MSDSSITPATVLIVDDNPKNIQVLGTILMDAKYRVAVANQGSAALNLLPKVKPDLILLDIMMPELDGFEVCRRIKAEATTGHIPVIFLTAKTETDDIVKGFELGAADFVTKPFRAKELLARVQTHIALVRLQQSLRNKNRELEEAFASVKTLSGFVPICSHCKKIRTAAGEWELVEVFIHECTGASFSHSICPECTQVHFSDYHDAMKKQN